MKRHFTVTCLFPLNKNTNNKSNFRIKFVLSLYSLHLIRTTIRSPFVDLWPDRMRTVRVAQSARQSLLKCQSSDKRTNTPNQQWTTARRRRGSSDAGSTSGRLLIGAEFGADHCLEILLCVVLVVLVELAVKQDPWNENHFRIQTLRTVTEQLEQLRSVGALLTVGHFVRIQTAVLGALQGRVKVNKGYLVLSVVLADERVDVPRWQTCPVDLWTSYSWRRRVCGRRCKATKRTLASCSSNIRVDRADRRTSTSRSPAESSVQRMTGECGNSGHVSESFVR
jgi:hypothetical protein